MVFSAKSRNSAGTSSLGSTMTPSSGSGQGLPYFRIGVFAGLAWSFIILAELLPSRHRRPDAEEGPPDAKEGPGDISAGRGARRIWQMQGLVGWPGGVG